MLARLGLRPGVFCGQLLLPLIDQLKQCDRGGLVEIDLADCFQKGMVIQGEEGLLHGTVWRWRTFRGSIQPE